MKRILFLLLLWPASVWADIDCRDTYAPHEPITISVTADGVPEGAKIRGTVVVTNAKIKSITQDADKLKAVVQDLTKAMSTAPGEIKTILGAAIITLNGIISKQQYDVWAPEGRHTVTATGVWVLTRDVQIGEESVPVLVDFGQYGFSKDFTVGTPPPVCPVCGKDPCVCPTPPPPPADQKWMVVFFIESKDVVKLPAAQHTLVNSLLVRQRLNAAGHNFIGCFDKDRDPQMRKDCYSDGSCVTYRLSDQWTPWWDAVLGDQFPRIAIAPLKGGHVQDFPLPADEAAMHKLLKEAKLLQGDIR